MRYRAIALIAVSAVLALVLWPWFIGHRAADATAVSVPTAAPGDRDDERRDSLIAFWEGAVRENHTSDMFSPRELASQYLQRYREKGDIGDVLRAQHMAQRSLGIEPRNIGAIAEMASVMLTLHRFRAALHYVNEDIPYDPAGAEFLSQKASLLMELGEYRQADATLDRIASRDRNSVAAETIRSRYDELTGHLAQARALLADATAQFDIDAGGAAAQPRAWYRFRAGELAFETGDNAGAIADEHDALALFPTYNLALKDLAKFELANHRYAEALDAAIKGAEVTPFPETLGYEADAQAALGDAKAAAATRDLIFTIERIGNAYRVNDRLLAIYYADHRLRPNDALAIARREAAVRGDEIYAQDTLAWAAAMAGHWDEARRATARATRFDTEDPIVQFHAGMIALHFGERGEAKRRLARALALNPNFHATYADQARQTLATL
jgi:tetratricopeptide (TPR) repeat protein